MKDTITNANFPRTDEGRVYHLGLKDGDLANRILTVGDPSRARFLAERYLYDSEPASLALVTALSPLHKNFLSIESERGFLTFTGYYKGVRMSIVAIGMGFSNMDFLVREGRECVNGDMYMIRFGSCGCLTDLAIGSVVAPKASVAVTRNYDHDFARDDDDDNEAYRISKPTSSDPRLHALLVSSLTNARPHDSQVQVVGECVNASADSFYSSQGRITSFSDKNDTLLERLIKTIPGLATLEMETFHLLHLAASSRPAPSSKYTTDTRTNSDIKTLPPTREGVSSISISPTSHSSNVSTSTTGSTEATENSEGTGVTRFVSIRPPSRGKIYAAAAHMVFGLRNASNTFITPDEVKRIQLWAGKGCLDALAMA